MSRSVVDSALQVEQLPVPVARAAGEQADGRDIGREIERAGGQRRLQGLAAVVAVGHHALGDIAVEFDIDVGQRDRRADHVGARLQREAAEAAGAGRRLAGPAQRVAQRRAVGGQRAFHHQAGAVGDGAVEGELQRRAGEPRLQAGALAGQRGDEVADADAAVDALAAPVELPGRGEGARDRRPGQRQVDIAERLRTRDWRRPDRSARRPGCGFRRTTAGCRRRASWCARSSR